MKLTFTRSKCYKEVTSETLTFNRMYWFLLNQAKVCGENAPWHGLIKQIDFDFLSEKGKFKTFAGKLKKSQKSQVKLLVFTRKFVKFNIFNTPFYGKLFKLAHSPQLFYPTIMANG